MDPLVASIQRFRSGEPPAPQEEEAPRQYANPAPHPLLVSTMLGNGEMRSSIAAKDAATSQAKKEANGPKVTFDLAKGTFDIKGGSIHDTDSLVEVEAAKPRQAVADQLAKYNALLEKGVDEAISGEGRVRSELNAPGGNDKIGEEYGGNFLMDTITKFRLKHGLINREDVVKDVARGRYKDVAATFAKAKPFADELKEERRYRDNDEKGDRAAQTAARSRFYQLLKTNEIAEDNRGVDAIAAEIAEQAGYSYGIDSGLKTAVREQQEIQKRKVEKDRSQVFNSFRTQPKSYMRPEQVFSVGAALMGRELTKGERDTLQADYEFEVAQREKTERRLAAANAEKPIALTIGEAKSFTAQDLLDMRDEPNVDQPTLTRRINQRLGQLRKDIPAIEEDVKMAAARIEAAKAEGSRLGMTAEEIAASILPLQVALGEKASIRKRMLGDIELIGGKPTAAPAPTAAKPAAPAPAKPQVSRRYTTAAGPSRHDRDRAEKVQRNAYRY
jgi:hypothetical protein